MATSALDRDYSALELGANSSRWLVEEEDGDLDNGLDIFGILNNGRHYQYCFYTSFHKIIAYARHVQNIGYLSQDCFRVGFEKLCLDNFIELALLRRRSCELNQVFQSWCHNIFENDILIRGPLERLGVLEKRNQTLQTSGPDDPQKRLCAGFFFLFFRGILGVCALTAELSAGKDKTVQNSIEERLQIRCSVGAEFRNNGRNHVEETKLLSDGEKGLLEDLLRGINDLDTFQLTSGNNSKSGGLEAMSAACCTLLGYSATIKQSEEDGHQLSSMLRLDGGVVLKEDCKLVLESGLIQEELQVLFVSLDCLLLPSKDCLEGNLLDLGITILHKLQECSVDLLVLIKHTRVDELREDAEHGFAVCERPSGSLRSALTFDRLRGSVFTCPGEKVWNKLTRPPLRDKGDGVKHLQRAGSSVASSYLGSPLLFIKALQHQLIWVVD
ncbi:hypothetical protein HG531_002221 [Fusarium graminearum]|nr:hypothetical protein HG531_002221 [Fusarium graminearum]